MEGTVLMVWLAATRNNGSCIFAKLVAFDSHNKMVFEPLQLVSKTCNNVVQQ